MQRAQAAVCRATGLGLAAVLGACGGGDARVSPAFPADYAASFIEVRGCRSSSDHGLNRVRVLADPAAAAVYQSRSGGFAAGAVVLKEEHDFDDRDCSGEVTQWTVMVREATGTSPATLDWHWQEVGAARQVQRDNEARCVNCHTSCGAPPGGYLGTCTAR